MHETGVEIRVVCNERTIPGKFQKHLHRFFFRRSTFDVLVPDPGQAGDLRRNGDPRIHECIELPDDLPFSEDLGSDLCHAVIHRVESGSLDIK